MNDDNPSSPSLSDAARASFWQLACPAAIVLLCWIAIIAWPRFDRTLGIPSVGQPYLDTYAVLAALDAKRAGLDPHRPNPLDTLRRPHVYSDWWLALRWVGLGRAQNLAVGTALVGAFALAVWVTLRPRGAGEAWWLAALLASPCVLLAVTRGNNDLVIFVLLAGCALAALPAWWAVVLAAASLGLATGLKYFPAPAALAFLWVRPVRRVPGVVLVGLLAAVAALACVWPEISRSRFTIASDIYTMGAPLAWRDYGWNDDDSALPGLLLLVGGALLLAFGRVTTGLAERGSSRERLLVAMGAIVLLACFMAGVNYAYRWIFVLWPAVWLGRQAMDAALSPGTRWPARLACALILACLWMDGLLAAVVNLLFTQYAQAWQARMDVLWRKCTQPLHWILMMMLAGWLCEGALATVREWWRCRRNP